MVAAIAAAGAAFGLLMALRSFRAVARIRHLSVLLVVVWALLPWRIAEDSDHFAPAFIVLLFRGLFEPDGEPGSVAVGLLLATAIALAFYFVGAGIVFAWRKRASQHGALRTGPGSPPTARNPST